MWASSPTAIYTKNKKYILGKIAPAAVSDGGQNDRKSKKQSVILNRFAVKNLSVKTDWLLRLG